PSPPPPRGCSRTAARPLHRPANLNPGDSLRGEMTNGPRSICDRLAPRPQTGALLLFNFSTKGNSMKTSTVLLAAATALALSACGNEGSKSESKATPPAQSSAPAAPATPPAAAAPATPPASSTGPSSAAPSGDSSASGAAAGSAPAAGSAAAPSAPAAATPPADEKKDEKK